VNVLASIVATGLKGKKQKAFHWVISLGAPGLFAVSLIDATIIPLAIPGSTDLLLLWLISHGGSPWLLAPCALVGSLVGAWTTWRLGKKGGKKAIEHYVPERLQKRIHGWSQHHPVLMVFLPAVLPPPIPLWPFLLAAGALGATWKRFLAAFGFGRVLRYGLDAWLAYVYGRHIIKLWSSTLKQWEPVILWTFVSLTVLGLAWSIWKLRRTSRPGQRDRHLHPSHAK
jgi:membrane protein YqaA with SNARE-associated domain